MNNTKFYILIYYILLAIFLRIKFLLFNFHNVAKTVSFYFQSSTIELQSDSISLKRPLKRKQKLVSKTNYPLMQVKSIAECSKGSILSTFIKLLLVIKIFVLSGLIRQVLLQVI